MIVKGVLSVQLVGAFSIALAPPASATPPATQAQADSLSLRALSEELLSQEHALDAARASAVANFDRSFVQSITEVQGQTFVDTHADFIRTMETVGRDSFSQQYETVMPIMRQALIEFYASHYSAEELSELIAFYKSAVGQKITTLQIARFAALGAADASRDEAMTTALADPAVIAFTASPVGMKERQLEPDAIAAGKKETGQALEDILPTIRLAVQNAAQTYVAQHPNQTASGTAK